MRHHQVEGSKWLGAPGTPSPAPWGVQAKCGGQAVA